MKRLMIDIETMGLHTSTSLVLSVGAVVFELARYEPIFHSEFLRALSWETQILAGRRIEPKTQKWWSEQPPEARQHWDSPSLEKTNPAYLTDYLGNFYAEQDLVYKTEVWANGVVFDFGNLENLIQYHDKKIPWAYNSVRDARTVYALPKLRSIPDSLIFVDHDPVEDCKKQIWRLWEHLPEEMLV